MAMTLQHSSTRKETCPSATMSTTNPTLSGLGSNPVRSRWLTTKLRVVTTISGVHSATTQA